MALTDWPCERSVGLDLSMVTHLLVSVISRLYLGYISRSVGLDLSMVTHLFLCDKLADPAVEQQARYSRDTAEI